MISPRAIADRYLGVRENPVERVASQWAYHGTMRRLLPSIRRYGLVHDSAPRLRGTEESGLFFSDSADYARGYGGADVLLRFPYPADVRPERHPISGRFLTHHFVTTETIPSRVIEVEADGVWHSLEGTSPRNARERAAARYKNKKEVPKADGKGTTTVYEYSERQVQNRNRDKAERIEKLRKGMADLRAQVKKDLTKWVES